MGGVARWRGIKGKKWENCNSIIKRIYFLKRIQERTNDREVQLEAHVYISGERRKGSLLMDTEKEGSAKSHRTSRVCHGSQGGS